MDPTSPKPTRRVCTLNLDGATLAHFGTFKPNIVVRVLRLLWEDSQRASRKWRGAVPHTTRDRAAARVSVSVPAEMVDHLDARCAETGAAGGDFLVALLVRDRRRWMRGSRHASLKPSLDLPAPRTGRDRPWSEGRTRSS